MLINPARLRARTPALLIALIASICLILLAPAERAEALRRKLWMVGLDHVVGFIPSVEGLETAPAQRILATQLTQGALDYVVDHEFGPERARIEYLTDWVGIADWKNREPVASHFELLVKDDRLNVAVLRRRNDGPTAR